MTPRPTAALVVLLLALGASCGGDDGTSDEDAGSSTTVPAEAAPTTVSTEAPPTTATTGDPGSEEESGALPSACDLVDPTALPADLAAASPESDDGTSIDGLGYSQCTWESEETLLVVAVVDGPERYEMHVENLPGEPLDGVGDEAITAPGISSETRGASGGRTVSALVGDRTLVVALRLDGETTPADVLPFASAAVERLG